MSSSPKIKDSTSSTNEVSDQKLGENKHEEVMPLSIEKRAKSGHKFARHGSLRKLDSKSNNLINQPIPSEDPILFQVTDEKQK